LTDWVTVVPYVKRILNTSPIRSIGNVSHADIVFGPSAVLEQIVLNARDNGHAVQPIEQSHMSQFLDAHIAAQYKALDTSVRVQEETNATKLQAIDKSMLARQKQKPLEMGELVTYDNSKAAKMFLPRRRGPMRVIEVDKDSITLQDLNDNLKVDNDHVNLDTQIRY
jgi:hypothetical protein